MSSTYKTELGDRVIVERLGTTDYFEVTDSHGETVLKRLKPLPTRSGIYSPGEPVSTGTEDTPVRLLMLDANGQWYWLDPSSKIVVLQPTIEDMARAYTLIPVALYTEIEN